MTHNPPSDQDPASDDPPTDDPRPEGLRRAESLVIVNTGDGKGKSTAAFGTMLRALAQGWPVAVLQFVKSGEWKVGEETLGRELGAEWHALGGGFTWDSDDLDHDRRLAADAWSVARRLIDAGKHRLIVLDELTYLLTWGWVDTAEVVEVIRNRPPHVSIIVTGRDAPDELIELADTVTEMTKVKHAYDQGIAAKKGLDY